MKWEYTVSVNDTRNSLPSIYSRSILDANVEVGVLCKRGWCLKPSSTHTHILFTVWTTWKKWGYWVSLGWCLKPPSKHTHSLFYKHGGWSGGRWMKLGYCVSVDNAQKFLQPHSQAILDIKNEVEVVGEHGWWSEASSEHTHALFLMWMNWGYWVSVDTNRNSLPTVLTHYFR